MKEETLTAVLVLLGLAVAVLFAILVGLGAGTLARMDGASRPAALARAGAAFSGALAVLAAVSAAISAWLM